MEVGGVGDEWLCVHKWYAYRYGVYMDGWMNGLGWVMIDETAFIDYEYVFS